jgi:hypothetical protein
LSGLRRAVLACVCAALSSCSVLGVVRAPRPPPPPGEPVACTRSRVGPWVDTFAAVGAASGAVAIEQVHCADNGCDLKAHFLTSLVVLTLAYGTSAIWGHAVVGECRDLLDRRAEGGVVSN